MGTSDIKSIWEGDVPKIHFLNNSSFEKVGTIAPPTLHPWKCGLSDESRILLRRTLENSRKHRAVIKNIIKLL